MSLGGTLSALEAEFCPVAGQSRPEMPLETSRFMSLIVPPDCAIVPLADVLAQSADLAQYRGWHDGWHNASDLAQLRILRYEARLG